MKPALSIVVGVLAAVLVGGVALASPEDQPKLRIPVPKADKQSPVSPSAKISPAEASDYEGLSVEFTLDKTEYRAGDGFAAQCVIRCAWQPRRVFNPFFVDSVERPGRVRVFNQGGKLVAEMLDSGETDSKVDMQSFWVSISRGGFVGAPLRLQPSSDLRPGNYRMQIVLSETIVSGAPSKEVVAASALVPFKVIAGILPIDH